MTCDLLLQESYGSHQELDKQIMETCDRFRSELDAARADIELLDAEKVTCQV